MNDFKEFLTGLLESVHRLVVTNLVNDAVEYFKADAGFQMAFDIGQ